MMKKLLSLLVLIVFGLTITAQITSKKSGPWNEGDTWNGGVAPTMASNVEINHYIWSDLLVSPTLTGSIEILEGGTFEITTLLDLLDFTISDGASLIVDGQMLSGILFGGSEHLDITVEDGGTFSVGENGTAISDEFILETGSIVTVNGILYGDNLLDIEANIGGTGALRASSYTGGTGITIFGIPVASFPTDFDGWAASATWIGGTDSNWNTATNWLNGTVADPYQAAPTSSQIAAISTTGVGSLNPIITTDLTTEVHNARELLISGGDYLQITSTGQLEIGEYHATNDPAYNLLVGLGATGAPGFVFVNADGLLYVGDGTPGTETGMVITATGSVGIGHNGYMTVRDGISNVNNSNLHIESVTAGSGSLIYNGGNVPVKVEMAIPITSWHFVSPPATGPNVTAGNFYIDNTSNSAWLQWWDEKVLEADAWNYYIDDTATLLIQGQGYAYYWQTNKATPGDVTFYGDATGSDVTLQLSNTGVTGSNEGGNSFSLIGNPFTSAIDLFGFDLEGLSDIQDCELSIWTYDGATNNYLFASVDTYDPPVPNTLTSRLLSMGQAFFVKANGSSPIVNFPTSMRTHSKQKLYKNSDNIVENFYPNIKLEVNQENNKDAIIICFGENGTAGFENGYDVSKFFGPVESPQMYMKVEDREQSLNYLPLLKPDEATSVPVSLKVGVNGEQNLKATFNRLDDTDVFLEDLSTGEMIDLKKNPDYSFTGTRDNLVERFVVHFKYAPTGIDDPIAAKEEAVGIYAYNKAVYISNNDNGTYETAQVSLFDMYGREIYTTQSQLGSMTRIPVQVNNSYLVVRVTKGSATYTEKVFVK